MSLDQVLMIPGFRRNQGGSSVTFSITGQSVATGSPVAGSASITINSPSAYSSYLPTDGSAAHMGYALRQLNSGYAGSAIRVRRASDDAEQDIGFVNGVLDTVSLESFCSGTDGFVTTWYEQTGNGVDLSQSTAGNQPQIVSSGSVFRHPISSEPEIRFENKKLEATHGSAIDGKDVTAMMYVRSLLPWNQGSLADVIFSLGGTSVLSVNHQDPVVRVTLDGTQNPSSTYDMRMGWPNIMSITVDGSNITWYRNRFQQDQQSHSAGAVSSAAVNIGSLTGSTAISEFVMYPALSNADRLDVYGSMNSHLAAGPTTENTTPAAILQVESWHVDLYDWLETITTTDVDITRSALSWDGTYADNNELSNLWLWITSSSNFQYEDILGMRSEHFVLDDGNGGGIEKDNGWRMFRYGGSEGAKSNVLAHWYTADIPKSGGAQGNPLYGQSGVAYRALVQAAVNLLGYDEHSCDYANLSPLAYPDLSGGALLGSIPAYRKCKGVLSDSEQAVWRSAFKFWAWKLTRTGARAVNANMDMKAIEALANVWNEVDTDGKAMCLSAAKQILFGSPTGTPATSVYEQGVGTPGVYDPAGHIREGYTPETTYNGHSLRHLTAAYSAVYGEADWSFLKTVIDSMSEFKAYQTFPDGSSYLGPSGYAGRTDGHFFKDQGDNYNGRNLVAAADSSVAYWYARHEPALGSVATMESAVTSAVSTINSDGFSSTFDITGTGAAHTNGSDSSTITLTNSPDLSGVSFANKNDWMILLSLAGGDEWFDVESVDDGADTVTLKAAEGTVNIGSGSAVDYVLTRGPNPWSTAPLNDYLHWPNIDRFFPRDDWYDDLKAQVDASATTTYLPFENTADINRSFEDDFWSFKASDGTNDYGWFMEALNYTGGYAGWFGGKLECFWTRPFGIAILCLRSEFAGSSPDRDYADIDTWPTMHMWGKDDAGTPKAFSTAKVNSDSNMTITSTFALGATPPSVTYSVAMGAGESHTQGQESGSEISGTWTPQIKVEDNAAGDGCKVTASYTSDAADDVTELWHSIPVHLLGDGQVISDTTIEYWNGSTWTTLSTSLVSVDWIRLTRDHGSGDKYVFIHFASTTGVKLSASVYSGAVQVTTRIRQIHCDIHPGTTGVATTLAASDSLVYDIQTTDPGLTPTDPAVSVTEPIASTTFFTNGFWFARANITFNDTNPVAKLQYSTDSTDGSDGTWSDVGTMTNTSGDEYVYLGEDVAIPSGLTYVRVRATDDSGATNSPVAASSTTPSLVLDDPFTAADSTVVGPSYSSWTTNTTGNSYEARFGTIDVQGNKAEGQSAASWHSWVSLDANATDVIVQGDFSFSTFSGLTASPGTGVVTRGETFSKTSRTVFTGSTAIRLYDSTTLADSITGSWSTSNVYRITQQTIGNITVSKVVDVGGGGTVLGYLVDWSVTNASSSEERHGFALDATGHFCDDYKIWA